MYQEIYNLIAQYIFGNQIVSGTYEELIAKLLAACGAIFCFAFPFIIIKKIVRSISE